MAKKLLFSAFILALTGFGACSSSSSPPPATSGADAGEDAPDDAAMVPSLDPGACMVMTGAGPAFSRDYVPIGVPNLEQKALYLLALLASDAAALSAIGNDTVLGAAGKARDAKLRAAAMTCAGEPGCVANAIVSSSADASAEGQALVSALTKSGRLSWLATEQMRPSGRFHRYAAMSDAELVTTAYLETAAALASGLSTYGKELGAEKLNAAISSVVTAHPETLPFFRPLELVVLAAMAADGRDEASRYEPLVSGENAAVIAAIPAIDFMAFPFSVILVPGQGPTDPTIPLDPSGKKRADLAAARFAKKLAPIVVVSGGHVHPDRTVFSEAIEMKKYLRDTLAIPESRIIVDPHARHTTTNLRNVSRLTLRYGVPADRPMLVTSDLFQSTYIGYWATDFGPRCVTELGYMPWRALVPISPNDSCMVPTTVSLHQGPRDLLDP